MNAVTTKDLINSLYGDFNMQLRFCLFVSCAVFVLVSCSNSMYKPDESIAVSMNLKQADWVIRHDLRIAIRQPAIKQVFVNPQMLMLWIDGNHFYKCPLTELKPYYYHVGSGTYIHVCDAVKPDFQVISGNSDEDLKSIVNALYAVNTRSAEMDAVCFPCHIDDIAQKYLAELPKPEAPEEVRRFAVMAASAVKDKHFEDAMDYFYYAESLAPWWPIAHFNRAQVFAEQGFYVPAVAEMTMYLKLVPDARDARQWQDKIYEWQQKAGTR